MEGGADEDDLSCCHEQGTNDNLGGLDEGLFSNLDLSNNMIPVSGRSRKIRIAVVGCSHGELDKIYAALKEIETDNGYTIDLLICCGDFQSVRNHGDLAHMHVLDKYKFLRTFYKYYSGNVVAPILTLFVGGNHEASGFLSELPNGGWVAEKIYYMGFSNVIRFAGLRISGLSGIFNGKDHRRGHYERPPFIAGEDKSDLISAYHVRDVDLWRLKQLRPKDEDRLSNAIDIMVSHDWPAGITDFGDVERLLEIKPGFKEDIARGKLGNPATLRLLYDIRPRYWLSAHLHVMFPALVPHKGIDGEGKPEPTRFLALDKPILRRHFIQVVELNVGDDADFNFSYDPAWLAILRSTDKFTSCEKRDIHLPSAQSDERCDFRPTSEEIEEIKDMFPDLSVPKTFRHTAPPIVGDPGPYRGQEPSLYYRNPQTTEFCNCLGISDLNHMLVEKSSEGVGVAHYLMQDAVSANPEEIRLDDEAFGDEDFMIDARSTDIASSHTDLTATSPNGQNAPKGMGSAKSQAGDSTMESLIKRRKVDIEEE